ncbi:hypothetical protein PG993_013796 [Apiospora rasikravindrae]|uniref:Uncharacterized protein n=1 Tax=Apiospora rasikravindrae TaxID=990691 RepID=A0ABR1RR77_9PEZI
MTPIDNAMRSKVTFGALVAAASAYVIWGTDVFPAEPDPKGNPEDWTREELRRWLANRDLHPQSRDTREQLLGRVKANMRHMP